MVTTWAAEFNLQDLDTVTIADEMRTETDLAEPLPELSVVFRTEKPKDVTVEHCELYEQPHLQNNKEVRSKVTVSYVTLCVTLSITVFNT